MDQEERNQGPETPLLQKSKDSDYESRKSSSDIIAELKKQFALAGPLMCLNLLVFSLQVISIMFLGHLGELALSGASMATSFASVTGFNLLFGMASALDTFCGQSYGAKQYHMLGIYMQRAMIILLLAQNNVAPMMLSAGITTLLHIFICWVLVFKSGLGNKGAALANTISYWINMLFLALYVRISPSCKRTWTGFSKEALYDIPKFIKLAIPSASMICLESWSFEMMVLLSGLLPDPKLETSVLSISLNTSTMAYMIPEGLSGATSIRVSNELGAGRPHGARLALSITVFLVVIEGTLAATIMILGRNVWGYCFSNEEKVVKYVGEMLILIAVSHFLNGIQTVFSGAARGCGWQKIGAIVNLGSYYLLGTPTGVLLAFVYHFGGKGLWMGLTLSLFVQSSLLLIIALKTDWEKEATKAANRVNIIVIPIEA